MAGVALSQPLLHPTCPGYAKCRKSNTVHQIPNHGYAKCGKSKIMHRIPKHNVNFSAFKTLSSLHDTCKFVPQHVIRRMNVRAKGDAPNDMASSSSGIPKLDSSNNTRQVEFLEGKTEYIWLLGPVLSTAAIVVPTVVISVAELLQKSYWLGLVATLGLDTVFVILMDVFFVLADKTGHHQKVPGGPSPWIGPWEYIGYPKGLPDLTKYLSYFGVGIAIWALFVSLIIGKLHVALSVFGPYLTLIFVQVAYERILENDKVPLYPLVPVVYSLYRFSQLARGMDIVVTIGGGPFLAWVIKVLLVLWIFYLLLFLAQVPWFYCTWNSNLGHK